MTRTMPLDARGLRAFRLLTAVESLESLGLSDPLQILYLPGEKEPYQVGLHRGDSLATALEKALRELSESGD